MTRKSLIATGAAALSLAMSACGGGAGGGGGLVSTPPPPPPPPQGASVTIFAQPKPETYATVGASISGGGGNLDTYSSAKDSFGAVSSTPASQPEIRYTSDGDYEIRMPGSNWGTLVPYKGLADPPADNDYFQPAGVAENAGYLVTSNTRLDGYDYSELGSWGSKDAGRWGYLAFGDPTPAGGVPASGSATFTGMVAGSADVMTADNLYGGYDPMALNGSVTLNFNFAQGTLGGSMDLSTLGAFDFTQTVFAAGSTSYSGKFDTKVAGDNYFLGQFTGPNAEETIGAWALPFLYSGDGQAHQAFGAWIAKQAP